jgi:hypothetical protein
MLFCKEPNDPAARAVPDAAISHRRDKRAGRLRLDTLLKAIPLQPTVLKAPSWHVALINTSGYVESTTLQVTVKSVAVPAAAATVPEERRFPTNTQKIGSGGNSGRIS